MEKLAMRTMKYNVIFGIALACVMLFVACDNFFETPETQTPLAVAKGYGKVSVNLFDIEGKEVATPQASMARTTFPSMAFDTFVYTFTKTDAEIGTVQAPNGDGYFILETGTYTTQVQAFKDGTLVAIGESPSFSVSTSVTATVKVPLSAFSDGEGEFTYTITYPATAEAEITLQRWLGNDDIILSPVDVSEGNGKTETLQLESGSYILSVLISKDDLYAGTSEAVHISKSLTTEYAKNFAEADMLAPCTVTFDSTGGTSFNSQIIPYGRKVTKPANPIMDGFYFSGWYREMGLINAYDFNTPVTADITLFAKWEPLTSLDLVTSLSGKLAWLEACAESGGNYIIEVNANESIEPHELSYSGKTNITITLKGIGSVRTVSLSSRGSMFTVGSGVTLILDNNIALQGLSNNNAPMVRVIGSFIMSGGAKISGNTSTMSGVTSYYYGGGVVVSSTGTFTMNGGEISGNTAYKEGGGVISGGTFTMNGGKISGNTARADSNTYDNGGGGVYLSGGTFTMKSGEISGNKALNNYGGSDGGGMYMYRGTFIMSGGEISNNVADSYGGGVYMSDETTFTMNDGAKITGNTATNAYGGGVYVASSTTIMGSTSKGGTFTMNGGEISGNTASNDGGGVIGPFTMHGGKISGNTARNGGGVYLSPSGGSSITNPEIFTMYGGEISGNTARNGGGGVYVASGESLLRIINGTIYGSEVATSLKNTASNNSDGAALYGVAQYGTLSGTIWNSNGNLSATNNTIRVVNGVLQP